MGSQQSAPEPPAGGQASAPANGVYRLQEAAAAGAEGHTHGASGGRLPILALAALGVVYGDIGTSPLYALKECFTGTHGVAPTAANVLGVLSIIVWSLVLIVAVKYLTFVMRADNRGEGGILALMALVMRGREQTGVRSAAIIALGIFGSALLYGDGLITPAISVLGAVEGLKVATPRFEPFIIPLSIAIIIGLFVIQKQGTEKVGKLFGPIMLVWFVMLGVLGLRGILQHPAVLEAIDPRHAVVFFTANKMKGFLVLGAVFLAVTGGEALYADMGHFGRQPIRLAWFVLAMPCLLLNYFGQGGLLINMPKAAENPFFLLGPRWALYPMVAVAAMAATIASQALISGAFSLTRQAIQMGYVPRMQIVHTSKHEIGQIYMPGVNWFLCVGVIILVLAFKNSSNLAGVYGVANVITMVITSVLAFIVSRKQWGWPLILAVPLFGLFLIVDLAYVATNVVKIAHGGWFPLLLASALFLLMTTWRRGRQILARRMVEGFIPLETFFSRLKTKPPVRVPGTSVFMTSNLDVTPPALLHNLNHNKVVHERVIFLTVVNHDVPFIAGTDRIEIRPLEQGFFKITAHYGFMQTPDIHDMVAASAEKGQPFDMSDTTFFLGREVLIAAERPGMALWRESLFSSMSRNARSAVSFFGIPPDRVIEIGLHVAL